MEKREKTERFHIRLTKEEKDILEQKMKLANCKNMSHFFRKCLLEKEIYNVDLEPFRDLNGLFSNATNNLNQIAKRVNSTGIIYKDDIDDIKNDIENFAVKLMQIHTLLQRRTTIKEH